MTDEEKRFDRREEARLDAMYDAQYEVDTAFNRWWNDDMLLEDNPYSIHTPMFWAWEGWQAALKSSVMTDEGQRRMLSFDNDVRALIKEAVEMEREACAQICDEQMEWGEINKSMAVAAGNCADLIRERGQ